MKRHFTYAFFLLLLCITFNLYGTDLEIPPRYEIFKIGVGSGVGEIKYAERFRDYFYGDLQIDAWGKFWIIDESRGVLIRYSKHGFSSELENIHGVHLRVSGKHLVTYSEEGGKLIIYVYSIDEASINFVGRIIKEPTLKDQYYESAWILRDWVLLMGKNELNVFRIDGDSLREDVAESISGLTIRNGIPYLDRYGVLSTYAEDWFMSNGSDPNPLNYVAVLDNGAKDTISLMRGDIIGVDGSQNHYIVNNGMYPRRLAVFDQAGMMLRVFNLDSGTPEGGRLSGLCLDEAGNVFFIEFSTKGHRLMMIPHESILPYENALFVNDDKVRIRESPSTDGKVLTQVGRGTKLRYWGESKNKMTIGGLTAEWKKVRTADGIEGWIFGAFVQDKPL